MTTTVREPGRARVTETVALSLHEPVKYVEGIPYAAPDGREPARLVVDVEQIGEGEPVVGLIAATANVSLTAAEARALAEALPRLLDQLGA